jgi:hypothetical protein
VLHHVLELIRVGYCFEGLCAALKFIGILIWEERPYGGLKGGEVRWSLRELLGLRVVLMRGIGDFEEAGRRCGLMWG